MRLRGNDLVNDGLQYMKTLGNDASVEVCAHADAVLLEIGQRCVRDHHGADVQAWSAAYCRVRVSVCLRALGALAGIARCRRPSAAAGDVRAALGAGQQGPSSALCSPGALARRQDA